ncbi:MAG TPA: hypothetical protein VKW08_18260 [Xanthobacteraceae bacterium]|jgi:translation elongation factor EF-G|nr:hypothetical protein [Xanthobacteraceae bacterium]
MTDKYDIPDAQPPLIEIAIKPKSKADQEKLRLALATLMSEGCATFTMLSDHYGVVPRAPDNDPTFRPAIGMRS